MAHKTQVMKHAELDAALDALAQDPEGFASGCEALVRRLDREGMALEIRDPLVWRKPRLESDKGRVPLAQQFRADVESILPLDRDEEGRLARRIEFARCRLDASLRAAGLTGADLSSKAHCPPGAVMPGCELPDGVCRRWRELHALRTEMVERNLYLVLINVERYSHTTASQLDLVQEASGALFRAVDGFDWRRGLLFRTYAVHWLNQAFRSYLYNFTNTVRVPVYLQKAMKHVNDARTRLGDAKASIEEIAEEAELGAGLVASAIAAARSSRSLDVAFDENEEGGGRLKDILWGGEQEDPYTTELEDVTLEGSLGEALDRLSERERFVVQQRFGIGITREHTLAEVAKQLGVSLERVRQIQVRALNKLRNPTLRRAVDPFLN
jgi:RNA polymerase sigma factor (sigma-70 family)